MSFWTSTRRLASLATLGLLLVGCDSVPYLIHLAEGELRIQGQTEPIDSVLGSGRLTDDEEATLRLMVDARAYAIDVVGLRGGNSYTKFYDASGDPLSWSLNAARQDRLSSKVWEFPITGETENLTFFDEAYLRRIEQTLIDDGWDTYTYKVIAYSTLGILDDPIRSTMLDNGNLSASETIFHELTHNTIFRPGASRFNESVATFVGRAAATEFLEAHFGSDSGWREFAEQWYVDRDAVNRFLSEFYAELNAYYTAAESPVAAVSGREAIFQGARDRFQAEVVPTLHYPESWGNYNLRSNNAWMIVNRRYYFSLDEFAVVYDRLDGNWPAVLDVFRAAARADGNPFDYLSNWAQEH